MRHFTLGEAESMIPELEKLAASAADLKARAGAKAQAVEALENAGRDSAQLAIERSQLEFLSRSLEDLLRSVETRGVVLKGLEPFLVDFPFLLEGRTVFLCWKGGEKKIRHFHGTDEGFANRKALPSNLLPH